jgi:hypothetical protein
MDNVQNSDSYIIYIFVFLCLLITSHIQLTKQVKTKVTNYVPHYVNLPILLLLHIIFIY